MSEVTYVRMPCGQKKKYKISGMLNVYQEHPGGCRHVSHAGDMFFHSQACFNEDGILDGARGWRCEVHTTEPRPMTDSAPSRDWRRIKLIDKDLAGRTNGAQGWRYVVGATGDA